MKPQTEKDVIAACKQYPEFAFAIQNAVFSENSQAYLTVDILQGLADAEQGSIIELKDSLLNQHLSSSFILEGFENERFRKWILTLWKHMSSRGVYQPNEDEVAWHQSLCESELVSSAAIETDFLHFYFDDERLSKITDDTFRYLERNQCGKALKLLRRFARYIPQRALAKLRATIWQNVAAIDPRFSGIVEAYRHCCEAGSSGPSTSSVNSTEGQAHIQTFSEDCREANDSLNSFASKEEHKKIEEMLSYSLTMEHFDSMNFRAYVLIASKSFGEEDHDSFDRLALLEDSLNADQLRVASELVSDFAMFSNGLTFEKLLSNKVQSHLERFECGKALSLIRENGSELRLGASLKLSSLAWRQVASIDSRFEEIANSFAKLEEEPYAKVSNDNV